MGPLDEMLDLVQSGALIVQGLIHFLIDSGMYVEWCKLRC